MCRHPNSQVSAERRFFMRNKISNILWGLIFIIAGLGFAGNVLFGWNFDLFFPGWWTLFIIIPCFISMIRNGFGFGATLGFIIGVLLLLRNYVEFSINLWGLIVPAILIYIGLRLIFQKSHFRYHKNDNSNDQPGGGFTSANKKEYSAVFSSNNIHLNGEPFTGADLNAVFGSIVLDLRDAIIQNDVEISANAIFAGIDIYIPRGVRVKINNVPIFGGVSNKVSQSEETGSPTIYLNSTCMFGGIDIK